jgi:hypothetical protein
VVKCLKYGHPTFELWNVEMELRSMLDDAYAIVNYDVSMYWSRPRHLKPACKFIGLNKFPLDELMCSRELGSWVYTGITSVEENEARGIPSEDLKLTGRVTTSFHL